MTQAEIKILGDAVNDVIAEVKESLANDYGPTETMGDWIGTPGATQPLANAEETLTKALLYVRAARRHNSTKLKEVSRGDNG